MPKLNLPAWTSDHCTLLEKEILRHRNVVNEMEQIQRERDLSNAELAKLEVSGGILHMLIDMRQPTTK